MGLWSYKSTNHNSLDRSGYYYLKVASYDGSFMGVLGDLVHFVSSFLSSTNHRKLLPQNVRIWQNSSIVRSYSPYGYGNDLSEVRSSSGSQHSRMRLSVLAVCVFPECNTLLYWNLTLAYMYVRSKILLLMILPPPSDAGLGRRTYCQRSASLWPPACPSGRSLNVLVERLPWTLLVHVVYSCMLTHHV